LNLPKPIEPKSHAEFDEQKQIAEKFNAKLKKILTDDQLEKWLKDKNKATPEEKAETRKERKERERKQQELLESLK
jgi:methylmalonyl-CoA mutase N-terminal domain/subunit